MQNLLTAREAALVLGIKEKTIRNWTSERRIQFVKLGSSVRYQREELERMVAQSTVEASR